MLDELIQELQTKLLQENSLEIFCYYFVNKEQEKINQIDKADFTGETEHIAVLGFSQEYADRFELEKVAKKINNQIYKKHLNIYHFLGLSLQDKLHETNFFEIFLKEIFNNQSIKYKFLITKIFGNFEEELKKYLLTQIEEDSFTSSLKYIYLESNFNGNLIISDFKKRSQELDVIDLILLEDLRDIQSNGYNKLQRQLFDDIIWCATEIQSKHKNLNNNEDQYNSFFQSLLTATKHYKVQDQTQRGVSSSGLKYGELDIAIFSKDDIPLSILEAFVIDSIKKDYITEHLKKLSENYDPTGLKNNYAVIYAKNRDFSDFWENYKNFVPTIAFKHEVLKGIVEDISNRLPQFAGIRVGLTSYRNRGMITQVFHIFMDMNLL